MKELDVTEPGKRRCPLSTDCVEKVDGANFVTQLGPNGIDPGNTLNGIVRAIRLPLTDGR